MASISLYEKFNPHQSDLLEEEEKLIHLTFLATVLKDEPEEEHSEFKKGGSLSIYHGGELHERLRRTLAPHMSGEGFGNWLKSSGFKSTLQGALKSGLKAGVSSFTSTDGSFKDKLKGALIAGAKNAVSTGSSGLLKQGQPVQTMHTQPMQTVQTVTYVPSEQQIQQVQPTTTANAVSRIMASLA